MLGLFKKKETVAPLVSNVENALREGSDLLSNVSIVLNDQLTGNLFCSGEVVIGADSLLLGNIVSEVCSVSGAIKGNISVTEKIDLKSTAVVEGNIQAPVLNIEEGAVINGRIAVTEDITLTQLSLLKKINSYTSDQFLSAKISVRLNNSNGLHSDTPKGECQTSTTAVIHQGTMRAAETQEAVADKPKLIPKELAAAAPPAKDVENAEANNRWW